MLPFTVVSQNRLGVTINPSRDAVFFAHTHPLTEVDSGLFYDAEAVGDGEVEQGPIQLGPSEGDLLSVLASSRFTSDEFDRVGEFVQTGDTTYLAVVVEPDFDEIRRNATAAFRRQRLERTTETANAASPISEGGTLITLAEQTRIHEQLHAVIAEDFGIAIYKGTTGEGQDGTTELERINPEEDANLITGREGATLQRQITEAEQRAQGDDLRGLSQARRAQLNRLRDRNISPEDEARAISSAEFAQFSIDDLRQDRAAN